MKGNKLKKGDKVVMHTSGEAEKYNGKIWKCATDSYGQGWAEVVMLEGYTGCYDVSFLQLVKLDNTEQSKNNGFMGFIQFIISVKRFVEAMEELGEIQEVEPEQAQKEQEFISFTEFMEELERFSGVEKLCEQSIISMKLSQTYEFFKTLPHVRKS